MAEKFSGVRTVSMVAIEMRSAIIELAGERAVFDSRARWLERAARKAGITPRMAKALFYCEVPDPRSSVVEQIRAAQATKRKDAELINTAGQTLADLYDRVQRLEASLRVADSDFHSDQIDALRRTTRNLDSALD